jgi:hypothetical protein
MPLACFRAGLIVVSLSVLTVGSVPASSEQAGTCHQYDLDIRQDFSAIRILLPVGTRLQAQQPTAICFELPINQLGRLREALERGPIDVSVFDREGRQLLGSGTLVTIDSAADRGSVHLRARFPSAP